MNEHMISGQFQFRFAAVNIIVGTMVFNCSTVLVFIVVAAQVHAQFDGHFWWQNKQLQDKAAESRSRKDVNFKGVLTEETRSTNHSERLSIEQNGAVDCTCVSKCKCANYVVEEVDHNGIFFPDSKG